MREVELPPGCLPAVARTVAAFARTGGALAAGLVLMAVAAAAAGLVVVAHGIAVLLIVLLANVVHELGHVVAYRMIAPTGGAVVASDGLHAVLRREALPASRDRVVTAAGPLAPLTLLAVVLPVSPAYPAEAVATGVVALAQASALVLPTTDRRAWREAGRAPSPRGSDSPTLGA